MTEREYYNNLKKTVDQGYLEYKKTFAEYNDLKRKRESGVYAVEYIVPKMRELKEKLTAIQDQVKRESKRLTEEMKSALKEADKLNASDLTEDARLLQGGLVLKERDIEGILERNSSNRTMTQLALRYAKEHDMKINYDYMSGEEQSRRFDEVNGAVGIVVKWFDTENENRYRNIYNTVFGSAEE